MELSSIEVIARPVVSAAVSELDATDVDRFLNYFPEMERLRARVDSFFFRLIGFVGEGLKFIQVPLNLVVPYDGQDLPMFVVFFPNVSVVELQLRREGKVAKRYTLTRDGLPSEWVPAISRKLPTILQEVMKADPKAKAAVEGHWRVYRQIVGENA